MRFTLVVVKSSLSVSGMSWLILAFSIFQICQSTSFKSATWPVGQMSREINFRCHSNLVHFVVPGHLHRSRHNHTQTETIQVDGFADHNRIQPKVLQIV